MIGIGPLLAHLLQPALHRFAHFAIDHLLVPDLDERRAAHPEADFPDPKLEMSTDGEAGQDER